MEVLSEIGYFKGDFENMQAEICFRLTSEPGEKIFSFVNNITTPDDGTHVTGFRSGFTKLINSYAKDLSLKESLQGGDIRNGLTAIISFKMHDPQFEGQTKGKLGSSSAVCNNGINLVSMCLSFGININSTTVLLVISQLFTVLFLIINESIDTPSALIVVEAPE